MNIRRRAVILTMVISAFLTYAAATGASASDDARKNVSPNDASVKVLLPAAAESGREEEEVIKHCPDLSYGLQIIKKDKI